MQPAHHPTRSRGFTLIELMVVIGIIVLLAAILMPVVSRVRLQAQDTSTQSQMQRIMQACESYYHDFNAYPGPIANANLAGGYAPVSLPTKGGGTIAKPITSSENLVLGLLGLMNPPTTVGGSPSYNGTATSTVLPPTHDVLSLNALHPATYHYIDYVPDELSTAFGDGTTAKMLYAAGAAAGAGPPTDSTVPEFVDRFSDPTPILYSRAYVGNPGTAAAYTSASTTPPPQYNWLELSPYGSNLLDSRGGGKWQLFTQATQTTMFSAYTSGATWADTTAVPFTDFMGSTAGSAYLYSNPNIAGSVRGKDGFILIDAGKDRTYGTLDDTIITP